MSEWKYRGVKRRDERHTKADVRPPTSNKKDTKKWCRGVVGREHKTECRDKRCGISLIYKALVCTECGKVMEVWYCGGLLKKWGYERTPPEWVNVDTD